MPGPGRPADYFQLAAVAALSLLILGNMVFRRSRGTAIVYNGDRFSAWVALGLAIFAFQTLQSACHLQSWLLPWFSTTLFRIAPLQAVGAAMMIAGIGTFVVSYLEMGASWRIGIDEHAHGALVTSGIFCRSRNPIYLAADVFMAGAFLLNPTLAGLIYLVLTPAVLHLQVVKEESFLRAAYGEQYVHYASNTARYI